jgi:hypothetical protein
MHAEDVGPLQFVLGNDHGVGPLPSLHTRNVPVDALKRHLQKQAALSGACDSQENEGQQDVAERLVAEEG